MRRALAVLATAGLLAPSACSEAPTPPDVAASTPSVAEPAPSTTQPSTTAPTTAVTEVEQSSPPTGPEATIYRPAVVFEGDTVIAELRPTAAAVDPDGDGSPVKFRLVEVTDGPFLEIILDEVVPAPEAELWVVTLDGRLVSKSTAHAGSTMGFRITDERFAAGVTVVFAATDADGTVIQSTDEVLVSR